MRIDNIGSDNMDIMEDDNAATGDVKAECDNILWKMTRILGCEP